MCLRNSQNSPQISHNVSLPKTKIHRRASAGAQGERINLWRCPPKKQGHLQLFLEETKGRFRKGVVLANVPSFRFFVPGEHANVPNAPSFRFSFWGTSAKTTLCIEFFRGAPPRGRQLYFTLPSASDPLFKASKAPFLTLTCNPVWAKSRDPNRESLAI